MKKFLKKWIGPDTIRKIKSALPVLTLLFGGAFGMMLILTTPLRYSQIVEPSVRNIENTEFHELHKQNPDDFVFIDVRDASTFAEGHPKGAINIPLAKLYTERNHLPKSGKQIVLICDGNSASGVAYSYLQHYGFSNIKRIPGGYREWLVAGLPFSTSTPPTGL